MEGSAGARTTSLHLASCSPWYPRALQLSGLSSLTVEDRDLITELIRYLTELNVILGAAQLQLGYRSRDEIGLFLIHARSLQALFTTSSGEAVDPLDLAFNLKVLPRLVGGTGPVRRALIELLGWAWDGKPLSQEEDAEELLDRWRSEGRPTRFGSARFPFSSRSAVPDVGAFVGRRDPPLVVSDPSSLPSRDHICTVEVGMSTPSISAGPAYGQIDVFGNPELTRVALLESGGFPGRGRQTSALAWGLLSSSKPTIRSMSEQKPAHTLR